MRYLSGLVLVVVLAVPALAQNWEKEPTSFIGIPFGAKKLDVERIARRRVDTTKTGIWAGDIQVDSERPVWVRVYGTDSTGFAWATSEFQSGDYLFMVDLFRHKYGEPTSEEASTVTNSEGASLTNQTTVWQGQNVKIAVERFGIDLTRGLVTVTTAAYRDMKTAEREAEIARIAGKF